MGGNWGISSWNVVVYAYYAWETPDQLQELRTPNPEILRTKKKKILHGGRPQIPFLKPKKDWRIVTVLPWNEGFGKKRFCGLRENLWLSPARENLAQAILLSQKILWVPEFMPISLFRRVCFRTPGTPTRKIPVHTGILPCDSMASKYANLYLGPSSFWSRPGCWPFLGPLRNVSRFTSVQLVLQHFRQNQGQKRYAKELLRQRFRANFLARFASKPLF